MSPSQGISNMQSRIAAFQLWIFNKSSTYMVESFSMENWGASFKKIKNSPDDIYRDKSENGCDHWLLKATGDQTSGWIQLISSDAFWLVKSGLTRNFSETFLFRRFRGDWIMLNPHQTKTKSKNNQMKLQHDSRDKREFWQNSASWISPYLRQQGPRGPFGTVLPAERSDRQTDRQRATGIKTKGSWHAWEARSCPISVPKRLSLPIL